MDLKDFLKSKKISFSGRVEFDPQGITKYVGNSSESYGVQFDPKKIVFIVDDTVFGSGKDGCVVAVNGIAFKSMLQRPIYFPFEKISNISTVGRRVVVNDGAYVYDFSIVE